MEQERDFKGIWIPKEIWLNEELSAIEKIILSEIDSLDNENHCTASNDYFADFCKVSISTVSKSIKHLEDLGLVQILEFNGRIRKMRVLTNEGCLVKKRRLPSKKTKAAEENLQPINIYNKKDNNKKVSIKNTNYTKSLVKKKSLYTKMEDEIYLFTKDIKVQEALKQFLNLQLEIYREQGKTYYSNIFKSRLNKLQKEFKQEDWLPVIQNAVDHGWQGFYPVQTYDKPSKKKDYNDELSSEQYSEEERKQIKKWQKEQIAKGERIVF